MAALREWDASDSSPRPPRARRSAAQGEFEGLAARRSQQILEVHGRRGLGPAHESPAAEDAYRLAEQGNHAEGLAASDRGRSPQRRHEALEGDGRSLVGGRKQRLEESLVILEGPAIGLDRRDLPSLPIFRDSSPQELGDGLLPGRRSLAMGFRLAEAQPEAPTGKIRGMGGLDRESKLIRGFRGLGRVAKRKVERAKARDERPYDRARLVADGPAEGLEGHASLGSRIAGSLRGRNAAAARTAKGSVISSAAR